MKPFISMSDMVYRHAVEQPDREAFRFLVDRHTPQGAVSYVRLYAEAWSLADTLRGRIASGARVPLVFAPGLPFITALLGCWLLRAVAVPLSPEAFRRSPVESRALLRRLDASCVLCDNSSAGYCSGQDGIPWLSSSEWGPLRADVSPPPALDRREVAIVQFTSGSTAAPRGVVITHGNVMANMEMIRQAFGHDRETVVAGWTPVYHDQGLIGNILQPLYLGGRCVLFSPQRFVRDPLLWLEIISDYRVQTSGGPNFAYDLCIARSHPDRLRGLDLSAWRVAFNGAEPVRAGTLAEFGERFTPYGFDQCAFLPCYGLAEATLFVNGGPQRGAKNAATTDTTRIRVGCGQPANGTALRIVDPDSCTPCPPRVIGEIWVRGEHVATGYWCDEATTTERFRARLTEAGDAEYLRTGDLGFVDEAGELFPTGRIKELVIQSGINYAPHDIEQTIAAARPELDPRRGVVFSVEHSGREQVIAVQEVRRCARHAVAVADIVQAIRREVAAVHAFTLHRVILVPPNTIPFTTSGKKMRARVRADYLAGMLPALPADSSAPTKRDETLV